MHSSKSPSATWPWTKLSILAVVLLASTGCSQGLYSGDPREISDGHYKKIVTVCEWRTGLDTYEALLPCINQEMDLVIEARKAQITRGERIVGTVAESFINLAGIGLQLAFSRPEAAIESYQDQVGGVETISDILAQIPSTE